MTLAETTQVCVRTITMTLATHNRSLALCARMNYETEVLDFIDDCPPDSVFYDLGACEGRFTLYAALKGLRVVAFEPENYNLQALKDNLMLNDLVDRVTVVPKAIGDSNGSSTLNIGQPWAGGHQKVVSQPDARQDLGFNFKTTQVIDICRLDDAVSTLPAPDFIKVDIDGSEMPFLRGAVKTLPQLKGMMIELYMADPSYPTIMRSLLELGWQPQAFYSIPNEPLLYNIRLASCNPKHAES